MIPASPADTPKTSMLKRKYYLCEALYWRAQGNRTMKRTALSGAYMERMNLKHFLNPDIPF